MLHSIIAISRTNVGLINIITNWGNQEHVFNTSVLNMVLQITVQYYDNKVVSYNLVNYGC